MIFTWDTTNLCVVFSWWHIRTTPGLVFSLLAIVMLAAGYEALRAASRRYEVAVVKRVDSQPSERSFLLLCTKNSLPIASCFSTGAKFLCVEKTMRNLLLRRRRFGQDASRRGLVGVRTLCVRRYTACKTFMHLCSCKSWCFFFLCSFPYRMVSGLGWQTSLAQVCV